MKINTIATLIAATITFGTAQAINYPAGNVTFNGSLSSTTCAFNLSGQGTAGNTVTLPSVPLTPFTNTGAVAGPTPFNLNISNCDTAITGIQIMFDGQRYNQTEFFANTAASNPATGIGVLLQGGVIGQTTYTLVPGIVPHASYWYSMTGGVPHAPIPLIASYVQLDGTIQPISGNVFVNTVLNVVY